MWFFKRKSDYKPNITDEMRAKANETRRIKYELEQAEKRMELKARLDALQDMANGGKSDKMEEMLMAMLMGAFLNPQQQKGQSNTMLIGETPLSSNNPTNDKIARSLANSIPQQYREKIITTSDQDLLDIRKKIVEVFNNG